MKKLNKMIFRIDAVTEKQFEESEEYETVFVAAEGDVVAKVTTLSVEVED